MKYSSTLSPIFLAILFQNQLNTLKNVVLGEYEQDNMINRYRGLMNLYSEEFFSSSHDELDPYEMFDGFGIAIKNTLEHGSFDQAWDVSLQPWFSPSTFVNFRNALSPEQTLFVDWYSNYPPSDKTGLNGLDGLTTAQIFKKYGKAFPDRASHLPDIDLTDIPEGKGQPDEVPVPPKNDRFYNAAQGNFEAYKFMQEEWNDRLRQLRAQYRLTNSDSDRQGIINWSRHLAGPNKELEDRFVNTDAVFNVEQQGNGNWVDDLI